MVGSGLFVFLAAVASVLSIWTILKVAAPIRIPMNLPRGVYRFWNHVKRLQANRPVTRRVGYLFLL